MSVSGGGVRSLATVLRRPACAGMRGRAASTVSRAAPSAVARPGPRSSASRALASRGWFSAGPCFSGRQFARRLLVAGPAGPRLVLCSGFPGLVSCRGHLCWLFSASRCGY
eukprot:5460081-Pyramimonas_sp.AAC.1